MEVSMRTLMAWVLVAAVGVGAAQTPAGSEDAPAASVAAEPTDEDDGLDDEDGPARSARTATPPPAAVRAADLPLAANAARKAGYSAGDVAELLDAVQGVGMSGGNAAGLLRRSAGAARKHAPVPEYAGFVREQLAAGVRGRKLVAAIEQAHRERGKALGEPGLAAPRAVLQAPGAQRALGGQGGGKKGKKGKRRAEDAQGGE